MDFVSGQFTRRISIQVKFDAMRVGGGACRDDAEDKEEEEEGLSFCG